MFRAVITGGPCAGKTTCMSMLSERLNALGRRVLICPEAATMAINAGVRPWELNDDEYFTFQQTLLRLQNAHEDFFLRNARPEDVILFDRGSMDNRAFCKPGQWQAMLDDEALNEATIRDARYDAVIHLKTAADGAEQYYTLENNQARTESPEEARRIDRAIIEAWTGHPHLRVIDNSYGTFEGKINAACGALCEMIGIPQPVEFERKFLLDIAGGSPTQVEDKVRACLRQNGVYWTEIDVRQIYLVSPTDQERRVRCWSHSGSGTYYLTTKRPGPKHGRIENERQITPREAWHLLNSERDPHSEEIVKKRFTFVWENSYCELDVYHTCAPGMATLEIEGENAADPPAFLPVKKELTGLRGWSNQFIAQRGRAPLL